MLASSFHWVHDMNMLVLLSCSSGNCKILSLWVDDEGGSFVGSEQRRNDDAGALTGPRPGDDQRMVFGLATDRRAVIPRELGVGRLSEKDAPPDILTSLRQLVRGAPVLGGPIGIRQEFYLRFGRRCGLQVLFPPERAQKRNDSYKQEGKFSARRLFGIREIAPNNAADNDRGDDNDDGPYGLE